LLAISKIILVAGISTLLVSVVLLYFGLDSIDNQISKVITERQHQTKLISLSIEEKFHGMIKTLEVTSDSDEFKKPLDSTILVSELRGIPQSSEPALRKTATTILDKYPHFTNVALTLPNGMMYFVEPYSLQIELENQNFAFRDWYRGVMQTNSPYFSEIFTAESTGTKTVKIAIPVQNELNEINGIWGGILNLDFLRLDFDRMVINESSRIIFFDHGGNIIVDTANRGLTVREKETYYGSVTKSLLGQGGSSIESIGDKKYLVTYSPVKMGSLFWGVVVIDPYEAAFSSVIANRDQIFFALGLVVAIIVASSVLRIGILRSEMKHLQQKQREIRELEDKFVDLDRNYQKLRQNVQKKPLPPIQVAPRHYLAIIVVFVAFAALLNVYVLFENQKVEKSIGLLSKPMSTGYVIQNLRGDTVDLWLSWNLLPGSTLTVNIKNGNDITLEQLEAVKKAILSTDVIALDDSLLNRGPKGSISLYYEGWKGALGTVADKQTQLFVPRNIELIESPSGEGDIVIEFTNLRSGDGYSGFTRSVVDDFQILKSSITVYGAHDLTPAQIGTIVRHEFGHALGLAHSTDPEDLMAPVVQTDYPYISECVVSALAALYDGSRNSQITCEK
jgi:hypothetical protein